MGLNPACTPQYYQRKAAELFRAGESPYFNMYKAGIMGIPIETVVDRLTQLGIPIRSKDITAWQDGKFKNQMQSDPSFVAPRKLETTTGVPFEDSRLEDFPMFPQSWVGCERRFFPCTADNKPLQKWGWSRDYHPTLYDLASAKALSPCGFVGQNMLYQRFIVIDIDGVGHGVEDKQTIAWGNIWKDRTLCYEDPAKPGSFHLYFSTDRLISVKHFPWAKIDLMGNAVNAAVYLKNKKSNDIPMLPLTNGIWGSLVGYQKTRQQ